MAQKTGGNVLPFLLVVETQDCLMTKTMKTVEAGEKLMIWQKTPVFQLGGKVNKNKLGS